VDDDGYAGPAELLTEDATVPAQVTLTGRFDPLSGAYHWYGRVAASDEVAALVGRRVVLRTPQGAAETKLTDVDPWGRPRVEGLGAAPFEVVNRLP
jgi:hypothetical protein